jgi:hypothetical protein
MKKTKTIQQLLSKIIPDNGFLRNIIIVYFNKGRGMDSCPYEVTESDQIESDQTRHYGIMESDKALFGMW